MSKVIWIILFLCAFAYPIIPELDDRAFELTGQPLGGRLSTLFVYAILALGLNVVVGNAGLLQLGIGAFFGVGAYITGILMVEEYPFRAGFYFCAVASMVGSALLAVLLSGPVLRLRGDYFALVTLGFGEVVKFTLRNLEELTAGTKGLKPLPTPEILPMGDVFLNWFNVIVCVSSCFLVLVAAIVTLRFLDQRSRIAQGEDQPTTPGTGRNLVRFLLKLVAAGAGIGLLGGGMSALVLWKEIDWSDFRGYYLLTLSALVLVMLVLRNLERSSLGRAWVSLREDELAAASMGLNVARLKLGAIAMGAGLAGLAGCLYAIVLKNTSDPDQYGFNVSIMMLCCLILGGVGNRAGVILGVILVFGFDNLVSPIADSYLQLRLQQSADPSGQIQFMGVRIGNTGSPYLNFSGWRLAVFGMALLLVMRFRPSGLIPARRTSGKGE